jgi:hypothetical protein
MAMETLLLTSVLVRSTEGLLAGPDAIAAVADSVFVPTSPHFFVAVIAGVILAAAFQLVLTDLALATGLNVLGASIGPEEAPHRGGSGGGQARAGDTKRAGNVLDRAQSAARKLSAAFGLWTLVSVSLSVFFAAWLAVLLSGTFSVLFGALLGLVIWALFTGLMTALEARVATSMVGALFGTARAALRGATEAASSLFSASPRKQAAEIAHDVAAAVREEVLGGEDLKHQLRDYLKGVEHAYSPRRIREELEKLLDHTEIEYVHKQPGPWFDEERVIERITSGGRMKPEQAKRAIHGIRSALAAIREEHAQGGSAIETVADSALRAAGIGPEEAESYRRQFEDYLRSTGKEALDPEGIKRDLERLFSDPRAGAHALRERLGAIDRDLVARVLAERTDMSQEDAHRAVDWVMRVVHDIRGAAEAGASQVAAQGQEALAQAGGVRERVNAKIHEYLDSLGEPELGYDEIRRDVELLFHDPRAGAQALLGRLRSIDRDTIKAMLAHRKDMSEEDAERLVHRIEEARDAVIRRAEQIREEVALRVEQAEFEAKRQAEETAHTASTAAWWAFGTTVVSAAAAVLGGTMPVR